MKNVDDILLADNSNEGILRLVMNNTNNKNSLSTNLIEELRNKISSGIKNDDIKVIIIAANGGVFSSGHDLKEITEARKNSDGGINFYKKLFASCSLLMQEIVNSSKPVIAEIDGVATAAGCQLVASCDLAIASLDSKFATPGVNIGLFCSTPMVAISRNISKKHIMEMLLTGEMINAKTAAEIGLINRCVNYKELTPATIDLANKIVSKSNTTISVGKKTFHKQYEMNLSDAYKYCSQVMVDNLMHRDAITGIKDFLKKKN